ncbi:MAG: hypothetical protein Q8M40_05350 [Legionella sp.]|nr:hypothetical protein [Legionella sp.]
MYYSYNEIQDQFVSTNQPISSLAVELAVSQLKMQAESIGEKFNCVVLNRNESFDELLNFINHLKEDIQTSQRVQIIYRVKNHWSTIDVETHNGHINMLMIDHTNGGSALNDTIAAVNQALPDVTIKCIRFNPKKDRGNCAYMAINDAFCLSKFDSLHKEIHLNPSNSNSKTIQTGKIYPRKQDSKHVDFISLSEWPDKYGSLVTNYFPSLSSNKLGPLKNNQPFVTLNAPAQEDKAVSNIKVNLIQSTLKYIKNHQNDHKIKLLFALHNLDAAIKNMRTYADIMMPETSHKRHQINLLVNRLESLAGKFIFATKLNKPTKHDFFLFKNEIAHEINQSQDAMQDHRHYWKVVLANVALALTGIGAIFLFVKSLSEKKPTFFFNQTQREENLNKVKSQVKEIDNLLAENKTIASQHAPL